MDKISPFSRLFHPTGVPWEVSTGKFTRQSELTSSAGLEAIVVLITLILCALPFLAHGMSLRAMSGALRKFVPVSPKISISTQHPRKPSLVERDSFSFMPHTVHDELEWNKQRDAFSAISDFEVVSFNLLAPVYKRLQQKDSTTGRRLRESSKEALWVKRAKETSKFFQDEVYGRAAIIAFQEYWLEEQYCQLFEKEFNKHGYEMRLLQRSGTKLDAVAILVQADVFDILGEEDVYLGSFGDRVALLLWLKHKVTGRHILLANTHLTFPHNPLDRLNQMQQMKNLTSVIDVFAHKYSIEHATRIVLGDFNVESHSPVCDHLRTVGYYSAFEVCPPSNITAEGIAARFGFEGAASDAAEATSEVAPDEFYDDGVSVDDDDNGDGDAARADEIKVPRVEIKASGVHDDEHGDLQRWHNSIPTASQNPSSSSSVSSSRRSSSPVRNSVLLPDKELIEMATAIGREDLLSPLPLRGMDSRIRSCSTNIILAKQATGANRCISAEEVASSHGISLAASGSSNGSSSIGGFDTAAAEILAHAVPAHPSAVVGVDDGSGTKPNSSLSAAVSAVKSAVRARQEHLEAFAGTGGSGSSSRSPVQFVSHRNHNQHEEGVDHIFVRPGYDKPLEEAMEGGQDRTSATASGFGSASGSQGAGTGEESIGAGWGPPEGGSGASAGHSWFMYPASSADAFTAASGEDRQDRSPYPPPSRFMASRERIFVAETQVLPQTMSCTTWQSEFGISDHRPIMTRFIIGRKLL